MLVDEVLGDFERIDLLFHCGWARPAAALLQLDEWDWQRTFETNVTSPYLLLKLAGRMMREQGGGTAGIFAVDAATPPAFAATQQARLALARAAHAEFLTYNIFIFAIRLGEDLSISGEAPLPPGGETPELAQAVQLAVQLAAHGPLPGADGAVYSTGTSPKLSPAE
ncbi:SDR family oxidoreductase [bacterium]|nr:MAG: SDR family oxidoreductase [bacterium]